VLESKIRVWLIGVLFAVAVHERNDLHLSWFTKG
jgi:hypothetical protein